MNLDEFKFTCPACKSTEFEPQLGKLHPWSIEIACLKCGEIGPDISMVGQEMEAEKRRKEQEAKAA